MRIAFSICWLTCIAVVMLMPRFMRDVGRIPSGTYPLDGAVSTNVRHQYLVFPKIHHVHENEIRSEIESLLQEIKAREEMDAKKIKRWRDALVDFASPLTIVMQPPINGPCSAVLERNSTHAVALERAMRSYWRPGMNQQCIEITATVLQRESDSYLEFRSHQREMGRTVVMNKNGGALAQILLWRDDRSGRGYGQVQALDPNLDIGSGLSPFPLDWPNLELHRDLIRSAHELRLPQDAFVRQILENRGQALWQCAAQLLQLDYRDSWGRSAHAQWCYGDAFPKILENDHYYAFRLEE